MHKLPLPWVKHIKEPEQKDKFVQTVLASSVALNRLRELLEEDLASLERPKETDYENPSWSHLQAHRNGRIQQINSILTLLEPIKR